MYVRMCVRVYARVRAWLYMCVCVCARVCARVFACVWAVPMGFAVVRSACTSLRAGCVLGLALWAQGKGLLSLHINVYAVLLFPVRVALFSARARMGYS